MDAKCEFHNVICGNKSCFAHSNHSMSAPVPSVMAAVETGVLAQSPEAGAGGAAEEGVGTIPEAVAVGFC